MGLLAGLDPARVRQEKHDFHRVASLEVIAIIVQENIQIGLIGLAVAVQITAPVDSERTDEDSQVHIINQSVAVDVSGRGICSPWAREIQKSPDRSGVRTPERSGDF